MVDPLIGRTLGGAFLVERPLGQGGMGAVYVARHTRTGKRYAVKVLRPDHGARSDEAAVRFEREAAALAELNHPGIVAIQDFAQTEDGIDYLVMDLLEGEDLSERMARVGRLPLAEALRIFHETAVALMVAHEAGIIHRDLKPGNVFLRAARGAPDRAMVLDFGLARMTESADAQHLTASGVAMGTPLYMAPEQAAGERVGEPADQYALAVMLYEMLTGEPPFTAPSAPALLVKVLTTTAPTLAERGAAPSHISAAVAYAMNKSPDERFESIASFLAAVEGNGDRAIASTRAADLPAIAATRAMPATAPPAYAGASPVTRPTLRLERTVPIAAGAAGLLALLLVGGAFIWRQTREVSVSVTDVRSDWVDGGVGGPPVTRQLTYTSTSGPALGATPPDASVAAIKPDAAVAAHADAGVEQHAQAASGLRRHSNRHDPGEASAAAPERNAHPANTPGAGMPPGGGMTREQVASLEETARNYEAQATAIEQLLDQVQGMRDKTRGLTDGHEPTICAPGVLTALPTHSDVPTVVSTAQTLRREITRLCQPFDNLRTPPDSIRSDLHNLPSTIDAALTRARDQSVSTNEPTAVAEQIAQALEQARTAIAGVPEGRRPFPCSSAPFSQLKRLESAGNRYAGSAAQTVTRLRDNICRGLGTDLAALRSSASGFSDRLDQIEGTLRTTAASYRGIVRQTRAAIR